MPRFGVAGYPPAFNKSPYGKDRLKIGDWLQSLGLDALELQMTYGPRTTHENCKLYRRMAADCGIKLSVHASYFIVFTSRDATKLYNSRETLKRTYELSTLLNADIVVLHPGPLYGEPKAEDVCRRFIDNLGTAMSDIGHSNIDLFVETAGKLGQLGSVEEILTICQAVPGVYPCIDFGHVHARTLGTLSSPDAVSDVFATLASNGAFDSDRRIHFHYTPIHFGSRGEISHRSIDDRVERTPQTSLSLFGDCSEPSLYHPRFEPVANGLRRWVSDCVVISETKDSQERGAIALRDTFLGSGSR